MANKNSKLWKLWQTFIFKELDGAPMPPGWLIKKGKEWQSMKRDGLIDVEGLSIKKKKVYKRGRKRGRRTKKC